MRAQAQTQRAAGQLARPPDGQQHVAGVERAGGASAAGRGADALRVEQQKQALALDALKAEAHIAGQTVHGIAVERTVRDLRKAADQPVAQSADRFRVFVHVRAGVFKGGGHAHDGGEILRAGALAALLRAAFDETCQGNALAGVQHADALRTVELVRGEREHIDVLCLYVDGDVPRRLHSVGVERHACLAADGADLADGQDGADLVVGVHNGHEARVLAESVFYLLRRHGADGTDGEQLDLKALVLEPLEHMQHGMMLERGRKNMLFALALAETRGGEKGLIVGLAAAGGEIDLARGGVQASRDALARAEQRCGRLLADGMQARGIAVDRFHIGEHGVDGSAAHPGRCGVVRVNGGYGRTPLTGIKSYLVSMLIYDTQKIILCQWALQNAVPLDGAGVL